MSILDSSFFGLFFSSFDVFKLLKSFNTIFTFYFSFQQKNKISVLFGQNAPVCMLNTPKQSKIFMTIVLTHFKIDSARSRTQTNPRALPTLRHVILLPRDAPVGSYDRRVPSSPSAVNFPSKQASMADFEDRQNLLGDEDDGSFTDRQAGREPGRPMLAICDPSRLLHRVVVLFFMCFLGFGE